MRSTSRQTETMRRTVTFALLVGGSLAAADTPAPSSPFDPIARIARARHTGSFTATFESKACSIRIAANELELAIPLRKVTWSMTTESDVIIVTARCPAKSNCISGSGEAHTTDIPHESWREPIKMARYAFQFAAPARDARKRFTELKGFATHCVKASATPAP